MFNKNRAVNLHSLLYWSINIRDSFVLGLFSGASDIIGIFTGDISAYLTINMFSLITCLFSSIL